jgi:putative transposase
LDRQFDVTVPDTAWVTDVSYIKTNEGFHYLAVVIDLNSRRVAGWSIQNRQTSDLVVQALLMAVWRRMPENNVLIHSDHLEHSMSRRSNCHDNAVAKSSSTSCSASVS